MTAPNAAVFYDPAGRRWRRLRRAWLALAVTISAVAAIFIASVLANPLLPRLHLHPVAALPHPSDIKPKPLAAANPTEQKAKRSREELQRALATTKRVIPAQRPSQTAPIPPPQIPPAAIPTSRPLTIGFYINWDESSYASLTRNLNQLDWVIAEWSHLTDAGEGGNPLVTDVHVPALNLIRTTRPQVRIIPMVQNLVDEQWNGELLARAIENEQARQRLISAIMTFVEGNKFGGVCVDFEEPPAASQGNLHTFIQELHAAFQPKGLLVIQAVPFDDQDWDYLSYAAATDYLILMAYDQHWSVSDPGSVAAQDWYERNLANRMRWSNVLIDNDAQISERVAFQQSD